MDKRDDLAPLQALYAMDDRRCGNDFMPTPERSKVEIGHAEAKLRELDVLTRGQEFYISRIKARDARIAPEEAEMMEGRRNRRANGEVFLCDATYEDWMNPTTAIWDPLGHRNKPKGQVVYIDNSHDEDDLRNNPTDCRWFDQIVDAGKQYAPE